MPFFRGSSWPRNRTQVFCLTGRFFTTGPPGKPSTFLLNCHFHLNSRSQESFLPLSLHHRIFPTKNIYTQEQSGRSSWCNCAFLFITHTPSFFAVLGQRYIGPYWCSTVMGLIVIFTWRDWGTARLTSQSQWGLEPSFRPQTMLSPLQALCLLNQKAFLRLLLVRTVSLKRSLKTCPPSS